MGRPPSFTAAESLGPTTGPNGLRRHYLTTPLAATGSATTAPAGSVVLVTSIGTPLAPVEAAPLGAEQVLGNEFDETAGDAIASPGGHAAEAGGAADAAPTDAGALGEMEAAAGEVSSEMVAADIAEGEEGEVIEGSTDVAVGVDANGLAAEDDGADIAVEGDATEAVITMEDAAPEVEGHADLSGPDRNFGRG